MLSRGYTGELRSLSVPSLTPHDLRVGLIGGGVLLIIIAQAFVG
jgi:hypothetical protein